VHVTQLASSNGVQLDGRALRVQLANVQRTVLVCAHFASVLTNEFLAAFGSSYGPVEQTETVPGAGNVGFLKFQYREDALAMVHTISLNPLCGWSATIYAHKSTGEPSLFDPHGEPLNRYYDDAILSAAAAGGNMMAMPSSAPSTPPPLVKQDSSGHHTPTPKKNARRHKNPNPQQQQQQQVPDVRASPVSVSESPAPGSPALGASSDEVSETAAAAAADDLTSVEKCQVFIGGIDPTIADDSEIKKIFARCGEIVTFSLKNNSVDTKSRDSFAFVRYHSAEAAATAIRDLHGMMIGAKKIRVQPLEPASTKRVRKARHTPSPDGTPPPQRHQQQQQQQQAPLPQYAQYYAQPPQLQPQQAPEESGSLTPPQTTDEQMMSNSSTPEMVSMAYGVVRDGDKPSDPQLLQQQQQLQMQQQQQQQQQQLMHRQQQQQQLQHMQHYHHHQQQQQRVTPHMMTHEQLLYYQHQQQQYAAAWWQNMYQQQAAVYFANGGTAAAPAASATASPMATSHATRYDF
jgi:RNA recognition motif-containing protein